MGKFEQGILGGFSGKVGSVIGGNWKGIDYMRGKAKKRKFEPTQKQLEQQAKFALVMRFLQPISALLEVTFKDFAIKKTGVNSAFSYNFGNAITGTYPGFLIDYSKVLVSRGLLPNVLGPAVIVAAGSVLTWSWTDNTGGDAQGTDLAILVAYCPILKQAIYQAGPAKRSDLTADLNSLSFSAKVVETYIAFISEDGKTVSASIFTGEVTVS